MASNKGQAILEYSVLIAIGVATLLAMQVYIKRAYSGKLHTAADSMGNQYAPRDTTSKFTINAKTDTTNTQQLFRALDVDVDGNPIIVGVMQTTTTVNDSKTTRTGTENVGVLKEDLWE